MAYHYQLIDQGFHDLGQPLDDVPTDIADRVPRGTPARLGPPAPVIDLSDDDSDGFHLVVRDHREQRAQRAPSREVISISSSSDEEPSDLELTRDARPTQKRSRNPGSSVDGSPRALVRFGAKRPATSQTMVRAAPPPDPRPLPSFGRRPMALDNPPRPLLSINAAPPLQTSQTATSENTKEVDQAPYYVDGRFNLKMYRGPGYERFPVVLGTVEGHQEICDNWDADLKARTERRLSNLRGARENPLPVDDSDSGSGSEVGGPSREVTAAAKSEFEKKVLDSVLEVFPDIDCAFVERKIRVAPPQPRYFDEKDEELVALGPPPLASKIISEIVELDSYPKQPSHILAGKVKVAIDDGTGDTINWDRSLPKDEMYLKDATMLIAKHFSHVPTHFLDHTVREKKSIFNTFIAVHKMEVQYYTSRPKPYPRRTQARTELEKKYASKPGEVRIPGEYAQRVNELQAAKQHAAREEIKDAAKKAKEEAEALNVAEHIKSGSVIECQCCFDAQTPLNRVVPCTADVPHYFCFSCVEGLADSQVGMLQYEMLCMEGDGCTAKLSHDDVGRAVPITTFDRLELNQQQAEIMAAGIEGLEQCPFCDYKAVCLEVEQEPVFYCANPECARATCRLCKKNDHTPKTCKEASVDKIASARHLIEEARSMAIIRICRKCKTQILKDYGCNKMQCAHCKTYFCYNCNEDLSCFGNEPYNHFKAPGSRCVLYDDPRRDRHALEALEAEKQAILKAKAADAELDETELQIDTGEMAKDPNARPPAVQNLLDHPAGAVFFQDLNNRAARLNHNQRQIQNMQARIQNLEALQPDAELDALIAGVVQMDEARAAHRNPMRDGRMQERLHYIQARAQAAFGMPIRPPPPPEAQPDGAGPPHRAMYWPPGNPGLGQQVYQLHHQQPAHVRAPIQPPLPIEGPNAHLPHLPWAEAAFEDFGAALNFDFNAEQGRMMQQPAQLFGGAEPVFVPAQGFGEQLYAQHFAPAQTPAQAHAVQAAQFAAAQAQAQAQGQHNPNNTWRELAGGLPRRY